MLTNFLSGKILLAILTRSLIVHASSVKSVEVYYCKRTTMHKNFLGTISGVLWTWGSAEIESSLKLISMALGVIAAIFFAVKMYYDMKSSINKYNDNGED